MRADKFRLLMVIALATVLLPCPVQAQVLDTSPSEWSAPEYPGFVNIESQRRRAAAVGSGPSFATEIHVDLVEKLPAALACTEVLARAQWRQDILLATVAKAHFDNCQFDAATEYVQEQLDQALAAGGRRQRDEALSALGRALHAIQDFYSHTDYVEGAIGK